MKKYSLIFMLGIVACLLCFTTCKKDKSDPSVPVKKLKKITADGETITFEYNAAGKLSKMTLDETFYVAYQYLSNMLISTYYDSGDIEIDTAYTNSDGYIIKETSGSFETNYEYTDGYLSRIIDKTPYQTDTVTCTWQDGNLMSTNSESEPLYEYYLDKPNRCFSMTDYEEFTSFYGKTTKNLLKKETYHAPQHIPEMVYEYTYEFDSDGYVTKMTKVGGGDTTIFTIEWN